jgi:hypothetical protein
VPGHTSKWTLNKFGVTISIIFIGYWQEDERNSTQTVQHKSSISMRPDPDYLTLELTSNKSKKDGIVYTSIKIKKKRKI